LNEGTEAYCDRVQDVVGGLADMLPYLAMFACFMSVTRRDPGLRSGLLMASSTGCDAPYEYLQRNDWSARRAVTQLTTESRAWGGLVKLRAAERRAMQARISRRRYTRESFACTALKLE